MASLLSAHTSEIPTDASVGHVVFGGSLKMNALRHVLQTLELKVLGSRDALSAFTEIRVSFDGCEPQACTEKAAFIRALEPQPHVLLQFSIGKVPEIGPLLAQHPSIRKDQGTIFDPKVQVFADCWRSHSLRRFLEWDGPETIKSRLNEPFKTSAAHLLEYAALPYEKLAAQRFIELVGQIEAMVAGWLRMKTQNDTQFLESRLYAWSMAKTPRKGLSPPGPLYEFCRLVRDLDDHENFETTVAELHERILTSEFANWHKLLTRLQ